MKNNNLPPEVSTNETVRLPSKIASLKMGAAKTLSVENAPKVALQEWEPRRLEPEMFPDNRKGKIPTTVANVAYMLEQNGIMARYNVIKKKLEISIPAMSLTMDNADNVSMTHIISLATLNGMRTDLVPTFVEAIADRHAYNPAADWIRSVPWDGKDRLAAFYETLQAREGFPPGLKKVYMRKWLLSIVAAALKPSGFKCRGVLTLQGPQSLGKTSWGLSLINDPVLRDSVIKTDHHLDGGNKDSQIGAITHLIVEIGELESSFKRDIARLKGFLTADSDKVRRPYARVESEYPRRTVFYATVNQSGFLVDPTGNNRFWTIPVVKVDYEHNIDMQQLFAQLVVDFENGEAWWLNAEEEAQLADQNKLHQSYSIVAEKLADYVDFDRQPVPEDDAFTASELLELVGIERPTNPQAKECGDILRQAFGEPKRNQGRNKWRIPKRCEGPESDSVQDPVTHIVRKKDKFD